MKGERGEAAVLKYQANSPIQGPSGPPIMLYVMCLVSGIKASTLGCVIWKLFHAIPGSADDSTAPLLHFAKLASPEGSPLPEATHMSTARR